MDQQTLLFIQENVTEIRIAKDHTTICFADAPHQDRCIRVKGENKFIDAIKAAQDFLAAPDKDVA